MSALPDYLHQWFVDFAGPPEATPLRGGDVNQAALVNAGGQKFVAKWKMDAPQGLYQCEAEGLLYLRRANALRVPTVVTVGDYQTPFIVMEYIPTQPPVEETLFARRLGEGLAALHRDNVYHHKRFGFYKDNFLGSQPQPNTFHADWPTFYRDCRLLPQIEKARSRGLIPAERERLLGQITDNLETRLGDFDARPVLVHGDLWSGNFLSAADNEPVLIDPAVYYGEREVEIAYTELFGGFPRGYLAAYHAALPLDPGYERRRALHQLYPLLVHLNHFGEMYGPAVDRACRAYAHQF